MTIFELMALAACGLTAGVINTLAGGGSLLTVPLLVAFGLPGTMANGTNRVGVLAQTSMATWGFRRRGIPGLRESGAVLLPVLLGAFVGAVAISRVSDVAFERMFGLVMLVLLVPTLRPPRATTAVREAPSGLARFALFFVIGVYGGAFQAGVGVLLVLALSATGYDLVLSNSIKNAITLAFTIVTLPVFILGGQISWIPALALAVGFAGGGELGSHIAVRGGEKIIRPFMVIAVLTLAAKMLGFY
ncbi:MAG: putative membrane protein YfcA [Hyphomicrobiaceae bacterium]